jgi:hypothetical protein
VPLTCARVLHKRLRLIVDGTVSTPSGHGGSDRLTLYLYGKSSGHETILGVRRLDWSKVAVRELDVSALVALPVGVRDWRRDPVVPAPLLRLCSAWASAVGISSCRHSLAHSFTARSSVWGCSAWNGGGDAELIDEALIVMRRSQVSWRQRRRTHLHEKPRLGRVRSFCSSSSRLRR